MTQPSRRNKTLNNGTSKFSDQELSALGRTPPQAVDIEKAVLGALMLEKDALSEVIELLSDECFYLDQHISIFKAIKQLFNLSSAIDLLTVRAQLDKDGTLQLAGGAKYLAELTTTVNSAANIVTHTRILVEKAIKRQLIKVSGEIQREAYEASTDSFELLDKMEQALFQVSEMNIKKSYQDMQSLMAVAIQDLEAKRAREDGLTGVPSGFTDLDRITSGWQKSDLVIIAARPGMGKTAFVLSALSNASVRFNKPVALFSLEMSSLQLINRMISGAAEIESGKIKTGRMEDYEWEQLVYKTATLSQAPIYIDDTPAISVLELRAKCRRLKAKHNIELIIVDYLQLMTVDSGKGGQGNREQEIATISRSLKQIAKELNVPVIALAQLSRQVENRGGDKRPMLSDLRESGSIEQDADMVMFLYRPEYYGITEDENGQSTMNTAEVIIAKHRNGSLETVNLKFIGKYTRFSDLDELSSGAESHGQGQQNASTTITANSKINNGPSIDNPPF